MDLKHQHIDDGSQFTWQCLADGNPFPQYSWYRNGTLIPTNDPDVTVKNNILTIAKANNLKHGGMYQCGATNILGQVLSSAQLRVLGTLFFSVNCINGVRLNEKICVVPVTLPTLMV